MTVLLPSPARRRLVILAYPQVEHEKDYLYHWMPFSLLTIAQRLLADGDVDVVIFDGNQRTAQQWTAFLDEHLDRAVCIGVSIMTGGGQIRHALDMVREAKLRSGCPPVVFGGPHVNVLGEQTAAHELVDMALVGPGQRSMPELVRCLLGSGRLDEVPGLLMTRDGHLVKGPVNAPKTEMMAGYPWQLLNVQEYVRDDPTVAPRTLNYVSSQGCVYKCQFCYELTYQRAWSAMPADPLVRDIAELVEAYDLSGIKFYDADFFVQPRRAVDFCQALAARQLGIGWAASINPNDVLRSRKQRLDLLGSIAGSGCRRLLMGIESGSDRVLREVVRKEITREQAYDVAADIAAHGILGCYTFIVGFPGETDAEVDETYDLLTAISQLHPRPETRVHLFGPFPGTPLFDDALRYGFEAPDTLEGWADFDYYDSQTPWTSAATVARARAHTRLVKQPGAARAEVPA
ncbi:B12-binding domain-containing radical SAM protein [Micromonospora sp. DT44]|uniref:B12-binding domain-containing radical SAM protein n=1 Tax=Micromonospora sp. DT44 TaxID=3393439 RepID=UPI003CF44C25